MAIAYGFFPGMDFAEYAAIDALNYSSLKYMMRSPMSYRWHKDNPQQPTPEMILGTAIHSAILEPELVGDFSVWGTRPEEKVRNGKVWEAFQERNAGKFIVTVKESQAMIGMVAAVRTSDAAMRYLGVEGDAEVSAVWHDPAARRICKGRLDKIGKMADGRPFVADLKSCRDARPFRFGNEAYRLGYHVQLAMYQDGYYYLTGDLPAMKEIAVESKPPHEIVVYDIPDDVLQQGKDDLSRLIQQLRECEESNQWPPALETETELTLPSYAYGYEADDLTGLELVGLE